MKVLASLCVGLACLLGWLNPSGSCVYAQYDDCYVTCSASAASVGVVGSPVQFSVSAQTTYCTGSPSYSWNFGNGLSSSQESTSSTYQSPGTYNWTVTVTVQGVSASQSGSITINHRPVTSISAASYDGAELASESIVAAFGTSLATGTQTASTNPLPTEMNGARVQVRDSAGTERSAPLFYVSPAQINFLIPQGTAAGMASVTIINGSETVAQGTVSIATIVPGLFTANSNGQGVPAAEALRLKADGTRTSELVAEFDAGQNRFVARPLDLGPATDQLFLILYGTGIRYVGSLSAVTASIGGVSAEVLFAGAQGVYVGLDQINLLLPRGLAGRGEVDLALVVGGKAAKIVRINIR